MYFTRRRNYLIFARRKTCFNSTLDEPDSARSSDELLPSYYVQNEGNTTDLRASATIPKTRRICCCIIHTPNTSRFRDNIHSRILQKFPFLIEMFYWVINYAFYRMTSISSQRLF